MGVLPLSYEIVFNPEVPMGYIQWEVDKLKTYDMMESTITQTAVIGLESLYQHAL
jgi:hypothetical protein